MVSITSRVAGKHPQTTYTVLQKFLQQEWDFVQRVTPYIETAFQIIEDSLRDVFLLALLKGGSPHIPS